MYEDQLLALKATIQQINALEFTTKNTICRGGFFRGGLLNRLYRQLLRQFS
jgi:hypothetical protein